MKTTIERIDAYPETEVLIKCGDQPDDKTKRLLRFLCDSTRALVGYQNGEAHKLDLIYRKC